MANGWMDGSEAVRCPKCDGKKDFRGRDLGMLRILPTGNGRLADVSCHSCDTGYRVVCPGCQRYMIGLTATKGGSGRIGAHRPMAGAWRAGRSSNAKAATA